MGGYCFGSEEKIFGRLRYVASVGIGAQKKGEPGVGIDIFNTDIMALTKWMSGYTFVCPLLDFLPTIWIIFPLVDIRSPEECYPMLFYLYLEPKVNFNGPSISGVLYGVGIDWGLSPFLSVGIEAGYTEYSMYVQGFYLGTEVQVIAPWRPLRLKMGKMGVSH